MASEARPSGKGIVLVAIFFAVQVAAIIPCTSP
jgi:hypothetical protein